MDKSIILVPLLLLLKFFLVLFIVELESFRSDEDAENDNPDDADDSVYDEWHLLLIATLSISYVFCFVVILKSAMYYLDCKYNNNKMDYRWVVV